MYILFTAGIACWLAYGLIIGDVPMTAANAITLVLATIILVTKVRNG
jgi:MtN3 and saliva related transmembrane protein